MIFFLWWRTTGSISSIYSMFSSSNKIFAFKSKETRAQTMHLDVVISFYRSRCLHTSSGNRLAFFLLQRFARIPAREVVAKTLMCNMSCLFVCAWRRLRWKEHDSRIQFLRTWDEELLAHPIYFECPPAVSDRYDTLGMRQISWNAARITLICITQRSPCALRFALTIVVATIHDVYRNYITQDHLQHFYLNLHQITSIWFLSRVISPSNFVEHRWRIWNRKKTPTLICLFYFLKNITTCILQKSK